MPEMQIPPIIAQQFRPMSCASSLGPLVVLFVAVLNTRVLADDPRPTPIDDERAAASGIRQIAGRHVTLYTDLPAGEVDELPPVFDAAVPLWCEYFGVRQDDVAAWKAIGFVMRDKERFVRAGLYPDSLPAFPHGYSTEGRMWIYDQPSAYYRRHLLLHEGTHLFMYRWLGGAGPPWYMEGTAELLGTHRWEGNKLALGVMPPSKENVPYWGRVKIVKDELAAQRGLSLAEIMTFDDQAHLKLEPYGWCWAAAAFLDGHPRTREAFRKLKADVELPREAFARKLAAGLRAEWTAIDLDWQLFVAHCDYGYDFARSAVIHRAATPLPATGAKVQVATDRGWQSTGLVLEAGKSYLVSARGRFTVAGGEKPWPCEAGGVTIRYHNGRPLGMLLGAILDAGDGRVSAAPLLAPVPIGLSGRLTPEKTGTLFLSINEASSGLADNRGGLDVELRLE
jgi:hypothetical protein